jgi:hypothetical protein
LSGFLKFGQRPSDLRRRDYAQLRRFLKADETSANVVTDRNAICVITLLHGHEFCAEGYLHAISRYLHLGGNAGG